MRVTLQTRYTTCVLHFTRVTPHACYTSYALHHMCITLHTRYTTFVLHFVCVTSRACYTSHALHRMHVTLHTRYTMCVLHFTRVTPRACYTSHTLHCMRITLHRRYTACCRYEIAGHILHRNIPEKKGHWQVKVMVIPALATPPFSAGLNVRVGFPDKYLA